ncbi:MAG: helix-turn-helix domain-containing protein [Kaiparowitsia implicata GSE-PSE-MK54-09C]|nr:helix-turn-helix domain-containing protein [Kaiparowitsia implicata GSE-PSE-MK54-09C]
MSMADMTGAIAPRAHFGTFSDPEAMATALNGIDPGATGPHPRGRKLPSFNGMLARATLGAINAGAGKFSRGIPQSAGIPNAHIFMFATEPDLSRHISGHVLGGSHIFHCRPNDRAVTRSPAGQPWAFGILMVPFDVLATAAPQVTGLASGMPLNDDRMIRVPETALARLVSLMSDLSRLARATPWILEAPEPARAFAGTLLEALLACLTQGLARRDRAALGRHRQIVARFETVLRERPEDTLSVPDLCAAVGVAERTLNLACQEFLGQSAFQYARERRLDQVRHTLLASDPATTQVTGVAMQYGFWELGRFARAYRLRFGERPSDTLRRAAASAAPAIHAGIA